MQIFMAYIVIIIVPLWFSTQPFRHTLISSLLLHPYLCYSVPYMGRAVDGDKKASYSIDAELKLVVPGGNNALSHTDNHVCSLRL